MICDLESRCSTSEEATAIGKLARLVGFCVGWVGTILYVLLAGPLLVLSLFVIGPVLVPLFAGSLILIFLSYVFTALVTATGTGTPPTAFALVCAAIYVVLCLPVLIAGVGTALFSAFVLGPLVLLGSGALLLFLLPITVVILVGYIAAATLAPAAPFNPAAGTGGVDRPGECFFRGALIGINAVLNGVFGLVLYGLLFTPGWWPAQLLSGNSALVILESLATAGVMAAVAVLVTATVLTILPSVTVAPAPPGAAGLQTFVEAVAGWLSWLMPMSWVHCIVGWAEFWANWICHFLSLLAPAAFPPATYRIIGVTLDGPTGAMTLTSGWTSNFQLPSVTGYGSGCFIFISTAAVGDVAVAQHEIGHHLHLAALGSFFSWCGAINENGAGPIPKQKFMAYVERIAESNVRPPRARPEVPMWS